MRDIEVGDYVITLEEYFRVRYGCRTGKVIEIIEGKFARVRIGNKINPYLLKDLRLYAKMSD